MATNVVVPYSLDDYFQSTPIGSLDKAIGNNLYGIDHSQIPGAVPSNRDISGFTFFVRPQLNLQTDNVRNVRRFVPLLNKEERSIQNFVRCVLDPRLQAGYTFNTNKIPARKCVMVDNSNPFISILTNNINSISGWPDITAPVFTSPPGLYNEAHSMVDGIVQNYEAFTVDASFRNTRGDPILYLFYIWLHYMANVTEGRMVPYLDMITEDEIDYYSRIYRITLDKSRQKVTKIFSTIGFPISVPTSAFADYNNDRPYNEQNKDITIRWQCHGLETFDDILIKEFNDTVVIFSPDMDDKVRKKNMQLLDSASYLLFKNRGLPRINPANHDLEWWVSKTLYQNRTNIFLSKSIVSPGQQEIQDIIETGD